MVVRDIVLIPTFSRPEMLWFCLERLERCSETRDLDLRVYVDAHDAIRTGPPTAEIADVLSRFTHLPLTVTWRERHPHQGNSYNVMMAYKEAYESQAEHVYLVEDDVMVYENFFAWHKEAQQSGDWFCSVASRFLKQGGRRIEDAQWGREFIADHRYASIGVCFKREKLAHIVEHANQHYFQHMNSYINTVFRDGRADQFTEQDGLIERIMLQNKFESIWPGDRPRCAHVGWYGYHRWNCPRPQGTLEKRHEEVKRIASDPQSLRMLSKHVNDVEPVTA
jgi:hypothetical protein